MKKALYSFDKLLLKSDDILLDYYIPRWNVILSWVYLQFDYSLDHQMVAQNTAYHFISMYWLYWLEHGL